MVFLKLKNFFKDFLKIFLRILFFFCGKLKYDFYRYLFVIRVFGFLNGYGYDLG